MYIYIGSIFKLLSSQSNESKNVHTIGKIFARGENAKSTTVLIKYKELDAAIACYDELEHSVSALSSFYDIFITMADANYCCCQIVCGRRVFVTYCDFAPHSDQVKSMLKSGYYSNESPYRRAKRMELNENSKQEVGE